MSAEQNVILGEKPVKEYYLWLDLLKIVSAIIIIFHHYQQHYPLVFSHFNFYGGINFGYVVELFFMISGGFYFVLKRKRLIILLAGKLGVLAIDV